MQVNIGAEDMIKEIRSATGIPFSDNMQRFVTLDRDFSSAETAEIMKEIKELLEVKKLVKEVGSAPGTFGGRGGGGASGKDTYGNDLPACKRFGKACFSYYQKGIKWRNVLMSRLSRIMAGRANVNGAGGEVLVVATASELGSEYGAQK